MKVKIKVPAQLRGLTGGNAEVPVEGGTVRLALDDLFQKHDTLRNRITDNGEMRRFVNVYIGEEDIRFLDGLDSELSDGDEITILPAVAGG